MRWAHLQRWQLFRRLGLTVFLDASVETLIDRLAVSKKKRPLLQVDDWESRTRSLWESRLGEYRRADITVRVDDIDLADGAERVLEAIRQYEDDADRPSER